MQELTKNLHCRSVSKEISKMVEHRRMLEIWTFILLLLALCDCITAVHDEIETNICSINDSGEFESGLDLQRIVNVCFGDAFAYSVPQINICNEHGQLDCRAIRNVLSVIPSCHYCNHEADGTEHCYIKQKNYTSCSVNYFLDKIKCVKNRGRCERKIFHSSSQSFQDVTTMEQTTTVIPEETTVASEIAEKHKVYHKYDKDDCKPCDCTQSERQTRVSVGVAAGLLLVGIVIGAIVTAVICICVPSLHSKTRTEKIQKSRPQENTDHYAVDPAVIDATLPVETTISYPVVPTAPISSSGSSHARYHTLNTVSDNRDSHAYTGLQPDSPEYSEPMGGGDTYESPKTQPMRGPNTIASPVYQEFTDNVIPSTGGNTSKYNSKSDNQNTISGNQPTRSTETNDTTSHTYSVLEGQNKDNNLRSNNERPVTDHHYFVLEQQNGHLPTNDITDKTDPNYHQYFVLEKEQT